MKLKAKPKPPKRKVKSLDESLPYNYSVDYVMNVANRWGVSYKEAIIDRYYIRATRDETDGEFLIKQAEFSQRLATYNAWYQANKKAIDKEIVKRKTAAKKKAEGKIAKEKARLQKELAKYD